ncbi:RECQL, partial [Cervus elaphus hippelaphus]
EHVKWVHAEMVNKNSKLKLIYVTPEKIAKSKMFMSRLEKAYEARRFTRIAVRQKPSNTEDFIEDIVKLINGRYKGQSGIIYCFSQKDSEQVTISLQKLGIPAGAYHANMEPEDKTKVHRRWSANEIQVVVATVAFGMGIDKPDVRFVIHHSMSKSMENYYQESGRAGRDDMKADCILYYGFGDIFRISSMVVMENVGQQKLYEMVSYCQNINKDLIKILKQAEDLNEKLTPLKLIDSWMGKGASKLRVAGLAPPTLPREDLEKIIAHFLIQQYLKEDYSFTAYATISYLKVGPKANLLNSEAHVITMRVKKPVQSCFRTESPQTCHSEGTDKKREEKTPSNFLKRSANMLQQPD